MSSFSIVFKRKKYNKSIANIIKIMIYLIIGDSMDNSFLFLITILFIAVLAIILVIYFIRSKKRNRIKRRLEELEVEKNKIDSSPIIPELAKVEAYLKNTKVKKIYN